MVYQSKEARSLAGEYTCDPFDLYFKDDAGKQRIQVVKIEFAAFMTITAFVYYELLTNTSVFYSI